MDSLSASEAVGVSMGTSLAIAISFTRNRSILWAILAGLFGWFYVFYAAIKRDYGFEYDPLPPILRPRTPPKQ